ncbi:flavin-containing monooxygenase [Plantactinospora solaniradicis]|uniref:Flavin-containing monooxygenase n=1 Tax=Plantactinospora solaniradicis TaxID=1723736 RepID=A0ABW1KJX7_9ACTN
MADNGSSERVPTVVIGAGQAGLAVGHHLSRLGQPAVILDAGDRVGDSWRARWDSLRLFSPARYDGLPGWTFPAPGWSYPTRDQVGDYLEAYADRFDLVVRTGVRVNRVTGNGTGYLVTAGERTFEAENVVVATGTCQRPTIPDFAPELDERIVQLHSSEYRNAGQLRPGGVLVVGAGNSGAEIAMEAARDHRVVLAGRDNGQVPFRVDGRPARGILPVLWLLANRVLTVRTPLGRKLRPHVQAHGGPLVRTRLADLVAAGVERHLGRVVGVRDGGPLLDDGRVLDVPNVVWCTGFHQEFGWIDLPVFDDRGWPRQIRGVVPGAPGLYFVGLPFLYGFGSMLVGGVGRDAAHIARHLARHRGGGRDRRDGHVGADQRAHHRVGQDASAADAKTRSRPW